MSGQPNTDYISLYKEMHQAETRYPGDSLQLHTYTIKQYIQQYEIKSLMDFGCGKGEQYLDKKMHQKYFNGVMPALYDPGVDKYSKVPEGTFDGVISTDVMEHIPESNLTEALDIIYSKADKFVYLGICTVLAQAILPNGENAHCTVKPLEWWVEKILPYAKEKDTHICTYGSNVKHHCYIKNGNIEYVK